MSTRLQLTDIRLAWPAVKPHVEALHNRYEMDWRPEDVYALCLSGHSFCWMCSDGFVIVNPRENPFTLQKELFVWICVHWGNNDLYEEWISDISEVAKQVSASTLIFESPREGWGRIAKKHGWRSMHNYQVPVL